MIEALKKLDKKFLIMASFIIVLPIFIIIFLLIIRGCSNSVTTHESYEKKMIESAEKYIKDKDNIPLDEAQKVTVKLDDLVKSEYIKSPEKLLNDSSCSGEVNIRRNGSSIDSNNGGYLNYTVNLECKDYKTVHLVDKLKERVVTQDSGLYKVGDKYIFKGDKVKNYITFYGHEYRIMSIDKNDIIKLIKVEAEGVSRIWDDKFNVDVNYSYGKNIYKDSAILKYLINDYENPKKINKKAKQHIVAYDTCIGKRSSNDNSISESLDCSETLPKQVVSLMNISDFAMASTDSDCNSITSRACRNYNYLSQVSFSTWTPNSLSDNSYEVFYLSDGVSGYQSANLYNEYSLIIYIDGNELYISGKGTVDDPYILK